MYAGIDLGTTNIKCAVYDGEMQLKARLSHAVNYVRENGFVEFDAEAYAKDVLALVKETMAAGNVRELKGFAFTGQAETLVVLGKDGHPLRNAISWTDERSVEECEILSEKFPHAVCEEKT
ncbi:MAG: hypothetical protein IKY02_01500, partial [Lachnospiraceae bacterium]|nr:hypothetical protein [Lachnospiraceae bacterium]